MDHEFIAAVERIERMNTNGNNPRLVLWECGQVPKAVHISTETRHA